MNKLIKAIKENNIEEVKKLLNTLSTRQINRVDYEEQTALHYAAFEGNIEIVKLLLPYMTLDSINIKDNDNHTALDTACIFQCYKLMKLIENRIKQLQK